METMVSSSFRERRIRLLIGLALTGLASVTTAGRPYLFTPTEAQPVPAGAGIAMDPALFQDGDVLFRRGRSVVSRAVLSMDGDSRYSHVGLVERVESGVWILHAAPAAESNGEGGVIVETLQEFLAPDAAAAAALYRPVQPLAAASAMRTAWSFVRRRTPFDGAFDLSTTDELYCTELIWRAYLAAGVDLCSGVPGAPCSLSPRTQHLLPSHLQASPQLRLIKETRKD